MDSNNQDVIYILKTEDGTENGEVIIVESEEVVVESEQQIQQIPNSENFVCLQQAEPTTVEQPSNINNNSSTIITKEPNQQKTYSKSYKSYAPTCNSTTVIYKQQTQSSLLTPIPISNQATNLIDNGTSTETNDELLTIQLTDDKISVSIDEIQSSSTDAKHFRKQDELSVGSSNELQESHITKSLPETPIIQEKKPKQKRKETLLFRPLNEEDLKMEFQIIEEPLPSVQEVEVRKRPRKEYRTKKKVRLAMEKMSKSESLAQNSNELEPKVTEPKVSKRSDSSKKDSVKDNEPKMEMKKEDKKEDKKKDEVKKEDKKRDDSKKEKEKEKHKEKEKETIEKDKRELPKRASKEKQQNDSTTTAKTNQQQTSPQEQPQRRTRLSNIYRKITERSYKCNDCDFSTDRINNIVLHVKESCPNIRR